MPVASLPALTWKQRLARTAWLTGERLAGRGAPSPEVSLWVWAIASSDEALAKRLVELQVLPVDPSGKNHLQEFLWLAFDRSQSLREPPWSPGGPKPIPQIADKVGGFDPQRRDILTETDPSSNSWAMSEGLKRRAALVIEHLLRLGADPFTARPDAAMAAEVGSSFVRTVLDAFNGKVLDALIRNQVPLDQPSASGWAPVLGVLADVTPKQQFETGRRRWQMVFQCLDKGGVNPWVVGPNNETLLSLAMHRDVETVRHVLHAMHKYAHDHRDLKLSLDSKFPLNLAEWVGQPHVFFQHEAKYHIHLSNPNPTFDALGIFTCVYHTLIAPRARLMAHTPENQDAEGRDLYHAWLKGGELTRSMWDAFHDDRHVLGRYELYNWAGRDHQRNTLAHALLSRQDAWDPEKTDPDLIQEIWASLPEEGMYRDADKKPHRAHKLDVPNDLGETPAQMFQRVSVNERWKPEAVAQVSRLLHQRQAELRADRAGSWNLELSNEPAPTVGSSSVQAERDLDPHALDARNARLRRRT